MNTQHGRTWIVFTALMGLFFSLLISGTVAAAPLSKGALSRPFPGKQAAAASPRLLARLYRQLQQTRNPVLAREMERRIVSVWASSPDRAANTDMRNALAALAARDFKIAARLLDRVIARRPDFADAWAKRAAIAVAGERFADALSDLREALRLDPHHFEAVHMLANVLRRTGHPRAALAAYRHLRKIYPTHRETESAMAELIRQIEGQGI